MVFFGDISGRDKHEANAKAGETCWGITLDTPITIKAEPFLKADSHLINIHDNII